MIVFVAENKNVHFSPAWANYIGLRGTIATRRVSVVVVLAIAIVSSFCVSTANSFERSIDADVVILGLTGKTTVDRVLPSSKGPIGPQDDRNRTADLDLKRMAQWAMHYLSATPRKDFNYEPVFQCHPLQCPPVPAGRDVVASCDTDARMNWEWYYMREITGSNQAQDIEDAFHRRLLQFVQEDGTVLCHPGCFNESDIHKVYEQQDYVIHVWGATKILHAMAEDYRRTKNRQSLATGRKILDRLKKLAVYTGSDVCYFPCGMGAVRQDGGVVPNAWNRHPAPIVEPLVNFYLATGDQEALGFATAYANGIVTGAQPDGIRFSSDGSFASPVIGHSHATMHALWGVAHLGIVTGEQKYLDFAKRSWDWMLRRGTGTGWFPAMPDNCNETCCVSDMISIAALLGQAGHAEYYDYVERYLRNYVSNLQFIVTPEFEAYYRKLHINLDDQEVEEGLTELKKFQGGIIGGSGLNDFENTLLGGVSGYEMFGCCAPEGMRAIYTSWTNTIEHRNRGEFGPEGVYVNLSFSRQSPWGEVVSYFPDEGRLAVKAAVKDTYFLRPPHWAPRNAVSAFKGSQRIPTNWNGSYVKFDADAGDELCITYPLVEFTHHVSGLWSSNPGLAITFKWRGNMVIGADPSATATSLFLGHPRVLPEPQVNN